MLHSFDFELEKLDNFETDYVKILYYDLPGNFADIYQSYSYTRFCTILEGQKHISIKNQAFSYDQNQALLLPAYSKVHMTIDRPTKALVFELSDTLIESVVKKVENDTHREISFNTTTNNLLSTLSCDIKNDITHLMHSSSSQAKEPFLIDLYAQKLIYDLLNRKDTCNVIAQQNQNPMAKAIQYMKSNLDQPFSSQELAENFNMSLSNFSHTFKKYTGLAPNKYVNQLKMDRAKQLLCCTSVTETAFELGYETPSHFIRLFKTHYGMTPKQFQLQQRLK